MSQVVDRFLQYVSFDTQSEEGAAKQPSTDKQWELARLLKQELEELGAEQVRLSEYGYICGDSVKSSGRSGWQSTGTGVYFPYGYGTSSDWMQCKATGCKKL